MRVCAHVGTRDPGVFVNCSTIKVRLHSLRLNIRVTIRDDSPSELHHGPTVKCISRAVGTVTAANDATALGADSGSQESDFSGLESWRPQGPAKPANGAITEYNVPLGEPHFINTGSLIGS